MSGVGAHIRNCEITPLAPPAPQWIRLVVPLIAEARSRYTQADFGLAPPTVAMDELAAVTQEDGLYDPPPLCGCGRHQPCRHCDEDDALNEAMEEGRPVFFVPGSPPFAGTQAKDPQ